MYTSMYFGHCARSSRWQKTVTHRVLRAQAQNRGEPNGTAKTGSTLPQDRLDWRFVRVVFSLDTTFVTAMVELTDGPIPINRLLTESADDSCGATVLFLGTTRRWTGTVDSGRTETAYLEYEAYREMALSKLGDLEKLACQRWPIRSLAIVHRLGRVEVKEASVAVVVSTPHRKDAFEAGQWLIDELKKQVPIWKKEWYAAQAPKWIHPPTNS
jgi:molybdopterin synthase catalytic subunit